jgi:hypothetical protein
MPSAAGLLSHLMVAHLEEIRAAMHHGEMSREDVHGLLGQGSIRQLADLHGALHNTEAAALATYGEA